MTNTKNKKIGVLGGGQLGKMLFEAGSRMNLDYTFLEKSTDCPASLIVRNQIVGSLQEEDKIEQLWNKVDVLTYEIEHVNVSKLSQIEQSGGLVIPFASVLNIVQDKGFQKDFYSQNNISTLPYKITPKENLKLEVGHWPDDRFVLKHRRGGYDGKGVQLLSKQDCFRLIENNDELVGSEHGYVIEQLLEDVIELSVIVAVGHKNSYAVYEPCEMVFDPNSNLMDYLIAPSHQSEKTIDEAKKLAIKAVQAFESPGLFAVELFYKDGQLFVNEIAPRPHNSGHHTIESSICSQYEQLNRILLGLPLGATDLIKPSLCCNIVGDESFSGEYELGGLETVLNIPGVYIHMYGKKESKPNRKLGHFTVISDSKEDCIEKMALVKAKLKIKRA